VVAEKLGYTLTELEQRMTPEELWLWAGFYELRTQEEKAAQEKAMKRRR
jgi:citrate synthase